MPDSDAVSNLAIQTSVPDPLRLALRLLLAYSALVVGWQLAGIALQAAGLPALAPPRRPCLGTWVPRLAR